MDLEITPFIWSTWSNCSVVTMGGWNLSCKAFFHKTCNKVESPSANRCVYPTHCWRRKTTFRCVACSWNPRSDLQIIKKKSLVNGCSRKYHIFYSSTQDGRNNDIGSTLSRWSCKRSLCLSCNSGSFRSIHQWAASNDLQCLDLFLLVLMMPISDTYRWRSASSNR